MHNTFEKVAGIIAEYNPFHKGHLYHIRKTKNCAQIKAIIALISSNFVQRGLPAISGKDVRARMALDHGADLVLELPVVFSSHNAGLFAGGAVDILAATGVTTHLSFGMEDPSYPLIELADILIEEPREFKSELRAHLMSGTSFVQARSMALERFAPGALEFLSRANNNLALAYVKRIREKGYPIEISPVERVGAGYHELGAENGIASATAIRELLVSGDSGKAELALSFMPERAACALKDAMAKGRTALSGDRFWRALKLILCRSGERDLPLTAEMREGLENRMLREARYAENFEDFVNACTSRRYPRGRIQRHCVHLLIGLTHEDSRRFQEEGPQYIRVLGANDTGRRLLGAMREASRLPVISRAALPKGCGGTAHSMIQMEHRAGEIWEQLVENPRSRADARFVPLIQA